MVPLHFLERKLVEISRTPGRLRTWVRTVGKRFQVGRHHLQLVVAKRPERLWHDSTWGMAITSRSRAEVVLGGVVVQRQLHKAQHAPAPRWRCRWAW